MRSALIFFIALQLAGSGAHALDNRERAAAESAPCLECHDVGPDAKVHALLAGSHGLAGDDEAMAGRHGCADCHGPSAGHIAAPGEVSVDVSFGPRKRTTRAWTAIGESPMPPPTA